jgi:hypothetical protein
LRPLALHLSTIEAKIKVTVVISEGKMLEIKEFEGETL